MIAADGHGRTQLAFADEVVHRLAHLGAFAVAKPADARRQALEREPSTGETEPAGEYFVVREELKRQFIGPGDVFGVATERHPAKGALAGAEERTYVLRHEARDVKRIGTTRVKGEPTDVVPVVECDRTRALQGEHRVHVHDHGCGRTPHILGS